VLQAEQNILQGRDIRVLAAQDLDLTREAL
jgi:hypothetical protein